MCYKSGKFRGRVLNGTYGTILEFGQVLLYSLRELNEVLAVKNINEVRR
jgi:hypothetical protein